MGISVNGVDISDVEVERELAFHSGAANPLKQAVEELVLRTVALQEARRLGLSAPDEDALVEALFTQEVKVPELDDAACQTWYRNHSARFTSGEMVEARHILFQVTDAVSLDMLRGTGEGMLAELRAHPERFDELAREYSNCPSGAVGGNLGQLSRGQTVPEFEGLVFRLKEGELAERLLETRFGLHIVQVLRRVEGTLLPFEAVQSQVAETLRREAWARGVHQYLKVLVGQAKIEGVELTGADSPLVQ